MTKISKILLLVLFSLSLFLLSSCKMFETETYECNDEIELHIKDEFYEYMPYAKEDVPTYTYQFGGKLNFTVNTTGPNEIVFSNNDDFIVSEKIREFLSYFDQNGIISYREVSVTKKYETHLNKKTIDDNGKIKNERVYFKVTDGDLHNMIAYITLPNGLQLTINYCTFEGENEGIKRIYYAWEYTQSIRMSLYYPLMVVDLNGARRILIVALPNGVINKVEPRYDPKGLTSKDVYLEDSFYTYPYSDYNEDEPKGYDNSNSVALIRDYYIDNFNGHLDSEGHLYYTYLGYDFMVTFGDTHFKISFIGESK